jgi:predicted nucleotidyltransferase
MKHAQTPPPRHPTQTDPQPVLLEQLLSGVPELEFAVLVGSRAQGTARTESDWDIALKWHPQADWLALLGAQENLWGHGLGVITDLRTGLGVHRTWGQVTDLHGLGVRSRIVALCIISRPDPMSLLQDNRCRQPES